MPQNVEVAVANDAGLFQALYGKLIPSAGFARLLAMEWRRSQQKLPLPLDDATLDLLANQATEDITGHDERTEALRCCLGHLTDRQRAVLRLRYQDSIPVATIATSWNRSQMAIYKMLKHIHRNLLDCITDTLARQSP